MLRVRTLVAALLVAVSLTAALPASAGAGDSAGETYRAYASIREHLISCSLDRTWRHLGSEGRRRCKRLRRLYVLWSDPGESYRYHVHCRTRKCPATPEGEPDARAPIPSTAQTFR